MSPLRFKLRRYHGEYGRETGPRLLVVKLLGSTVLALPISAGLVRAARWVRDRFVCQQCKALGRECDTCLALVDRLELGQ